MDGKAFSWVVLVAVLLLSASCGAQPTATPDVKATQGAEATATKLAEPAATAVPQPTATKIPTATPTPRPQLIIQRPGDGEVLDTPTIPIRGTAPSIRELIVNSYWKIEIDYDGTFSYDLPWKDMTGQPNLLIFQATDVNGRPVAALRTVYYKTRGGAPGPGAGPGAGPGSKPTPGAPPPTPVRITQPVKLTEKTATEDLEIVRTEPVALQAGHKYKVEFKSTAGATHFRAEWTQVYAASLAVGQETATQQGTWEGNTPAWVDVKSPIPNPAAWALVVAAGCESGRLTVTVWEVP
ncbi:MAG: hypothetical protein HY871_01360 [Chloroflexi bacterium]|nr:hypothetical protein [Chloroflexota bacterium]